MRKRKIQRKNLLLIFLIFFSLFISGIFLYLIIEEQRGSQGERYHQEAIRIYEECLTPQDANCYEKKFKELARARGLDFAEQTLYKLWDLDETTRRCHVIAHTIAKEAVRENPEKWKDYFKNVNYSTCSTGFLHGVMEAHIGDDPDFELNSKVINELCFDTDDFYRKHNCVHFTGHLFMVQYEGDMKHALDGCEGVNEDLTKRCYTGVFMEDSFPLALVEHGIRSKLPNRQGSDFIAKQEARCTQYEGDRAISCWTDMGENYGVFFDNPQKVYDSCSKTPSGATMKNCFMKATGLFAIHPAYSTNEKLIGICLPAKNDENLFRSCIGNMISSLLYYSPNFSERGVKLCSSLDGSYGNSCFDQLKRQIAFIAGDELEREKFCRRLSPKHKYLCRS